MGDQSAIAFIRSHADRQPSSPAILAPRRPALTYAELVRQIDATTATLRSLRLDSACIGIGVPDGPEMAVACLAVAASAAAAPVSHAMRAHEAEQWLEELSPAAVIADDGTPVAAAARRRGIPVLRLVVEEAAPAGTFVLDGQSGRSQSSVRSEEAIAALVLRTSGTLARPKLIRLTHINLIAAARAMQDVLQLTAADRCLSVMPLCHIHGLSAVFASLVAGGSVACPPAFSAEAFFENLETFVPTWYTAAPAFHHAILERGRERAGSTRATLRFVRSASAALRPETADALEAFFRAPVVEAYGLTEAAPQVASQRLAPHPRKRGSVGSAAGPEVAVWDAGGHAVPHGVVGEIVVHGANLCVPGWMRTGDLGYLDADGDLFVTGRVNERINTGGEKVAPAEVEVVALAYRGVRAAAAFAVPHPTLGQALALAVVPESGHAITVSDLLRFIAARLSATKLPQDVVVVDQLPLSPGGKIDRRRLTESFTARPATTAAKGDSDDATMLESLAGIFADLLGLAEFGPDDDFFRGGGDSLLAMEVIARVQSVCGVQLPGDALFRARTPRGLLALAANGREAGSVQEVTAAVTAGTARPLASTEARLWFLDRLKPADSAYHVQIGLRLEGPLDQRALESALEDLVDRHAALRTIYREDRGKPYAETTAAHPVHVPVVDLCHVPSGSAETEVARIAERERVTPFALSRGPLWRAVVARLSPDSHCVILTIHHIVCDGWSKSVICTDLAASYRARTTGAIPALPGLPLQFADFALAEHQESRRESLRAHVEYWRGTLEGAPDAIDLPVLGGTQDRGAGADTTAAVHDVTIPADLLDELERLSASEGVTLFMTIAAALQVVLARFSRQDDFVIGTPVANRQHPLASGVVGFFANTVALRADTAGDPSFLALLARVRASVLGALAHQAAPWDRVVDALNPRRTDPRSPLFRVELAFQDLPPVPDMLGTDVRMKPVLFTPGSAKFDLAVHVTTSEDSLTTRWQFATGVFECELVERLASSFVCVLRSVSRSPGQTLSQIAITSESELNWTSEDDAGPLFLETFERAVGRHPERPAVVSGGISTSYGELHRLAGNIRRRLVREGVKPADVIAVRLQRSPHAVAAFLGVLSAGCVYLPIDARQPQSRTAVQLAEMRARLVIADEGEAAGITTVRVTEVVDEDEDGAVAGVSIRRDMPAYVIYTSGSSGRPKGVQISHGNLASYVDALRERLAVAADDRYLHSAPLSFSSSIRQMALPLSVGGIIVLEEDDALRDADRLAAAIARHGVSVMDLVPSHWRTLLATPAFAQLHGHGVRLALSASEPLLSDVTAAIRRCFGPGTRIVNMYGQTETAGIVSCHDVVVEAGALVRRVPIGTPLRGCAIRIVDENGRAVPDGAIGEIVIGGAQVGHYVAADAESRFGEMPARTYRTGDLARWGAGHLLEFVGRSDAQVKIRGLRVEPGEVEAVIAADEDVHECLVTPRIGVDQRVSGLLAQVVFAGDSETRVTDLPARTAALRIRLARMLPEYLLPQQVIPVTSLPLTATGKLDRRPTVDRDVSSSAPAPPAGPRGAAVSLEEQLTAIWRRVLGRDDLGVHDNFFDLGGDSLLTIQAVSDARERGIALEPAQIFQHQTVADLARVLTPRREEAAASPGAAVRFVTIESMRAFACAALQQAGLLPEDAAAFADVQIEASLRGQTTHNVGAIPRYARRLAARSTNPRPAMRVERETDTTAILDADNGPGQLAALRAMDLAMAKARRSGVGIVGVRRSNHFGAAGHYVWRAAREGLIGLCTTNSALWLPATGGVTPLFGTNPIAAGIPSGRHHPIVLDVSLSATAKGKVALHLAEGQPLRPGWILDAKGRTSTDPADLAAGLGVPIGGHKGYGLAFVMEVLAGVLTGAGFASDHRRERLKQHAAPDFGHCFIAIDPSAFMAPDLFLERVDALIDQVKASERADGTEEVLLPGEREMRARDSHLTRGVPVWPAAWRALEAHRAKTGVKTELVNVDTMSLRRDGTEDTVANRFEWVAGRVPERIALRGDRREWTYGALNASANRLAHEILALTGDGSGAVAYLVHHSPEMVLMTLGILKAGKTYLAIHPGLPVASQAAIVNDVRPQVMVTTRALESEARAVAGEAPVLVLEQIGDGQPAHDPRRSNVPDEASTIFYTSGTTGAPKAVVKSHRAVLHRVWLSAEFDRVSPDDRQSLLTHTSFSASESDMFGALLQGATVCTFDIATQGLSAFGSWIDTERITLLHPPALFFRRFLATLDGTDLFPSVRLVALAGDVVAPSDVWTWQRTFSGTCVLLHRFSITETALLAVGRITRATHVGPGPLDAGQPVPDKHLQVVDDQGAPVEPGQTGELVVRSRYLASGYWNRPEETSRVFTRGEALDDTTYRTGDLARFTKDGALVHLGRRDHQVKIRGYRIDIREIEAALLRVDGVVEAAVVSFRQDGEQQLAAFVVPADRITADVSDIRAALREHVPAWAIPSVMHVVDRLPLTFTGKIDRTALERTLVGRTSAPVLPIAPVPAANARASDMVEAVAAVFARVLRVPHVDPGDDFFDVGGNSLLFAELQIALEREFRRDIPLRGMLQDATVAGLAALIRTSEKPHHHPERASELLVPLRTTGTRPPLFFVHGGYGHAVMGKPFLDALGDDQPMYAFQARGLDGRTAPHDTIQDMAAEYVRVLKSVQPLGPFVIGGACAGGLVAVEMAALLQASGERVAPVLMVDPASPRREQGPFSFAGKLAGLSLMGQLTRFEGGRRFLERRVLRRTLRYKGQLDVWWRFRRAAYRHTPAAYAGDAYVIGTPDRLEDFRNGRWGCLTGHVELVHGGEVHADVVSPTNQLVLEGLRRYATLIHAWASETPEVVQSSAAGF